MVFSDEDKVLIKNLYLLKNSGPAKLMSEFPEKNWKRRGLENLLKKLREAGTTDRKKGSGRPRSTRTEDNVSCRRAGSESGRATTDTSFRTRDFQRNRRTEVARAAHCP